MNACRGLLTAGDLPATQFNSDATPVPNPMTGGTRERPKATIVDAHAHFYPGVFTAAGWLDAADSNFRKVEERIGGLAAVDRVLLVADRRGQTTIDDLEEAGKTLGSGWVLGRSAGGTALWAQRDQGPPILIVVGQQRTSGEGLEVLSFGRDWQPSDGLNFYELVQSSLSGPGITILPWGFGKWMGRRGRLVEEVLEALHCDKLFVGDSGGRPRRLKTPSLIDRAGRAGIPNLPGSDPLPLDGQHRRVGSRGVILEARAVEDESVGHLWRSLRGLASQPPTFGRGTPWHEFVTSQIQLRLGG